MRIKQTPEDFIVREVTNVRIESKGEYIYFSLKKRDYTTLKAVETVANALRMPSIRFGFAGNKDKNAVTEQLVSVKDVKKEDIERLRLKDIELKVMGCGKKYISLGDLEGNEFIITVRDLSADEIDNFNKKIENKPILMPNYFGEQRFSEQNAEIGKAIIKRDFEKAAELLRLDIINNDYIGALRKINKKILRLCVHAYQSYIFNETAREYLQYAKDNRNNEKIPIAGFGTELESYNQKIRRIVEDMLNRENISLREFINVKMPELSEEGSERDLFIEIQGLEVLEKDKEKLKLKFFLKKGSYATEAISYLFNSI